MAQMLLKHLSDENAAKFGLRIESHAVADGKHHLALIIAASDARSVEKFTESSLRLASQEGSRERSSRVPFKMAGSVEIAPSSCELVVQRGFC
jgi:hypothetical protein